MITNPTEYAITTLQTLQSIASLKDLDRTTQDQLTKNFKVLEHRKLATINLEKLAYTAQDVLENIAKQSQILSLSPSWNETVFSTLEVVENAENMIVHAISKLCLTNVCEVTSFSEQSLIKNRCIKIAKIHCQIASQHKPLVDRAIRHLQTLSEEDNLDWGLIDRLTHAFFTIQQAKKQYFYPEPKKDR